MSDLFDEWGVDDDPDLDDPEELDEDDAEDFEFEEDDFEDGDFEDGDFEEAEEGVEEEDEEDEGGDDDDFDLDALDLVGGESEDLDGAELGSELAGSVDVSCPYCGAGVELLVDPVGGDIQEYVEDCEVCCQPWSIRVTVDAEGTPSVDVSTLDEV